MVFKKLFWLMAAGGLSLATFGKNAPREAAVPADPLEMVAGHIETVSAPAKRAAVIQLLAHARDSYALRSSGRGYDLKVSFTVNSGGETQYDGQWEMEDVFDPQQGLRWTASTAAGYTTTQISTNGMFYRDGTASTIPLRLQEARAALFDPIPPVPLLERDVIRTSASTYNGTPVTCVLLSRSGNAATRAPGRSWEETEECVDPQSGLLRVHSQVPGRYYAYDYTERATVQRSHVSPQGDCHRGRQNRDGNHRYSLADAARRRSEPVCPHRADEGRRTGCRDGGGAEDLVLFRTGSVPLWRHGPSSLRVRPGYGIGTTGGGALLAAFRSEQCSRRRSRADR